MTAEHDERAAYIAGLRQLADLLENDAELPLPDTNEYSWYLFGSGLSDAEQKERAAELVRRLPNPIRKEDTATLFRYRGALSGLRFQVIVDRSAVCKRVVVGTETVKRPDPNAPLIEVEQDKVEWQCEPLLADEPAAVAS